MVSTVSFIGVFALFFASTYSHGVYNLVVSWTTAATTALNTNGGYSPRVFALTHLAIYRTLFTDRLSSYRGANKEAAANYAGHYVLSSLYLNLQSSVFDPLLATELEKYDPSVYSQSQKLGKFYALGLLNSRANDGSFDYKEYIPADISSAADGVYVFTPNQTFAEFPYGGNTKTIISGNPKGFKAAGPNNPSSAAFQTELAEVRAKGRNTGSTRTAYQTNTSLFYHVLPNSAGLPGQWFAIARHYISPQFPQFTVYQTSRAYTLLALALYESATTSRYLKYKYNYWRPITAIRKTTPTWTPFLNTPNHPEYPSGHILLAAAGAYALSASINYTVNTRVANFSVPSVSRLYPSRYFTNLVNIVDSTGESRIYGGVHFRKAVTDGKAIGYAVGKFVVDKLR